MMPGSHGEATRRKTHVDPVSRSARPLLIAVEPQAGNTREPQRRAILEPPGFATAAHAPAPPPSPRPQARPPRRARIARVVFRRLLGSDHVRARLHRRADGRDWARWARERT